MIQAMTCDVLLIAMQQKSKPMAPSRPHARKKSWNCRPRLTLILVLGCMGLVVRFPYGTMRYLCHVSGSPLGVRDVLQSLDAC
jgi:hypothetical protein